MEVANQEPNGVADLAVGLPRHVKEGEVHLDVIFERQGGDPPAADIGPVLLQQFINVEGIPARLAHLATVFVDHEAMGQDGFVRGHAGDTQCGQQRKLEPAAVLVRPFEVQIDGVADAPSPHDGVPGRAGFHPHVKDVIGLLEGGYIKIRGCLRIARRVPTGQQLCWSAGKPCVGTFFAEDGRNRSHRSTGHQNRAVGITEGGNGQAPCALPGQAPIRTAFQHAAEAVAPPLGEELDAINRIKSQLPQ